MLQTLRPTLEDKLKLALDRPSGFDYMRLVLALSVVCFHSVVTSYGDAAQVELRHTLWRAPINLILPMFFALSGFLVAASLERSKTLLMFLGLRILRIIPALSMEVFLSALVLGPLFTNQPLLSYFMDHNLYSYFLNILGDIHYELPGVFEDNPQPLIVNGQLWTIPFELGCYLTLSALAIIGIFMRRFLLLLSIIAIYILQAFHLGEPDTGLHFGKTLIMVFLAGVLFSKYRRKFQWRLSLFIVSLLLTLGLLSIPNGERFVALPAAYMTVFLGVTNPPKNRFLLGGDYSYGLFLFGYPIQQAFSSIGPETRHWYLNLLFAIPATSAVAYFSWWFIEKPALSQRRKLKQLENWYLGMLERVNNSARQTFGLSKFKISAFPGTKRGTTKRT